MDEDEDIDFLFEFPVKMIGILSDESSLFILLSIGICSPFTKLFELLEGFVKLRLFLSGLGCKDSSAESE